MNQILLTIVALALMLLYYPLNRRKTKRRLSTQLDQLVPLISATIWPYMLFIPYLIFCFVLLWPTDLFFPYIFTFILTSGLSTFIWLIFPNGVTRPKPFQPLSLTNRLLNEVYLRDGDSNGFPSAHVSYTIVATYYIVQVIPHLAPVFWISAAIISLSTVTTKQHYVLDLIGGVVLAMLTINLVTVLS